MTDRKSTEDHKVKQIMGREIEARFPSNDWRNRPMKNFQSCSIAFVGSPTKGESGLASVIRTRFSKRSKWRIEISVWMQAITQHRTPDELRADMAALTEFAEQIAWPVEEINPEIAATTGKPA